MLFRSRYQTVKELQATVQLFQAGSTVSHGASRQPSDEKSSIPSPKKIHALVVALCVIIVLLCSLCVKLLIDRSRMENTGHGKL